MNLAPLLAVITQEVASAHVADEHATQPLVPEAPNLITLLHAALGDSPTWGPIVQWLHRWENVMFASVIIAGLTLVAWLATRRTQLVPHPIQNALELCVERLDELVHSVIGADGRHFTPFIGTLFLYILTMNFAGMVPGLKSPTSNLNMTLALALCVFGYVQYTGLRRLGVKNYVLHLLGRPHGTIGWLLAPLMGLIETIGELVKPLSLALRLGFNITAEDALIGFFLLLGAGVFAVWHAPVGLPLHILFYPLVVLFSTIQALVFSLLASVYVSLQLPQDDARHVEHQEV